MPGFLSSNLYYKYLSDLINSVRADEFVGGLSSTLGQSTTLDSDRGSNTSEGSQAQVNFTSHIYIVPVPTLYIFLRCSDIFVRLE